MKNLIMFLCMSFTVVFASINLSLDNVDLDAGTLSVVMENDESIGGFQFSLSGVSISSASGGSAQANGFTLSTSSSLVLGFLVVCEIEI